MMPFRSWCSNGVTWYGLLTLSLTLRTCCADDLTFTGQKYDGDDNITIMTGESFDVICTSQSDEIVSWWHNGNEIPEINTVGAAVAQQDIDPGQSRIYFFSYASPQDPGNYICKSENEEKILRMTIVDDLTFTGQKYDGDDNITIITGELFDIICTSQSNEIVSWWHNGNEVPEIHMGSAAVAQQVDPPGQCRIFFYSYASPQDSGNYICKSENDDKILRMSIVDPTISTPASQDVTSTLSRNFTFSTDTSNGTSLYKVTEDLNIAAIVAPMIIIVLLAIMMTLLLCSRRRFSKAKSGSTMKPNEERNEHLYEDIDDFPANRGEDNGVIVNESALESSKHQHCNADEDNYENVEGFTGNQRRHNEIISNVTRPGMTVHQQTTDEKDYEAIEYITVNAGEQKDIILDATKLNSLESISQQATNEDEAKAADAHSLNWKQSPTSASDNLYDTRIL